MTRENSSPRQISAPFLLPQLATVLASKRETKDTYTLAIRPPLNYQAWSPGQFNMLYLYARGEVPISISGPTEPSDRIEHTIRAVGNVTTALCRLRYGDKIWIRGPYGNGWPAVADDNDLLIIAGGIGLAPLRPALLQRISRTIRGRTYLYYGVRTPSDILFKKDLARWSKQPKMSVLVAADRVEQRALKSWKGSVGVVTQLLEHVSLDSAHTKVMTCGPEIMMRHVTSNLNSLGIQDGNIFASLERNMKCAIGLCGRCQWGSHFVCRSGPVYSLAEIRRFWSQREF